MATTTPAPVQAPERNPQTEGRVAAATTLAPLILGGIAPYLNTDAATAIDLAYLAAAGLITANTLDALPDTLIHHMPAGDILRAHKLPLALSALTTGTALAVGTLGGIENTEALMAGIAATATNPIPGIVSIAWWATVALIPIQLRNILRRPRHRKKTTHTLPDLPAHTPAGISPELSNILTPWAHYIAHPDTGTNPHQHLQITALNNRRWTGLINAPTGKSVTVTAKTVSSVYGLHPEWITIRDGAHAGEAHITVNLTAPPEMDTTTLAGAWRKWAARSGGIMDGTHLEQAQHDPHTGGEVAYVVADDNTDALPTPQLRDLVGALRTSHLLLSYEPTSNPRTAVIRLMKENPLQNGTPFPGPDALLPSKGGYFRLGRAVSGRPIRAQLLDPKLGARHLLVSGITGSGKGGVLQLIALAAHLAGAVIIYADPKGSSNPAIEKMAAYTGLGEDGAMGALLLMEALVNHRINLTGRLKLKNFDPTVMPHVVFILDEASSLLGEKAVHRKRATRAVGHIAKKGRSLGASEVLANQLLQLAEIGGDSAIRDNIVGSGGSIMLRSDSSQRHLIDLPPGMQSVNPADIPATWTGNEDEPLVYSDDVHIADPQSTFGLGYFMTTDGVCAMGRTYLLEDATEYISEDRIAEPHDWPDWDDRHNLVAQLMAEDADNPDDSSDSTAPLVSSALTGLIPTPKKPASAEDKILKALQTLSDPAGLEDTYVHKDAIGQLAGLEGSTLGNGLSNLVKANKIHRQMQDGKEVRGMYGHGPTPLQNMLGE